jgi:hypothetical protein
MLINKQQIQLALSKNHRKRKNSIGNNQLTQTKYIKYKSRLKYFRRPLPLRQDMPPRNVRGFALLQTAGKPCGHPKQKAV